MDRKISVVVNTLDCQQDIERVLKSVQWADEILVCDMHSEDKTISLAEKLGAKVIYHKRVNFVEPARNFAISKAEGEWVLILDPDEEVPPFLAKKLQETATRVNSPITYLEIPRKNIIFGKWVKAANWWPDYNIRFFKKGSVTWSDKIHRPPETSGEGLTLPAEEDFAINHYHYQTISQFLLRMNRYTDVQAKELAESGYQFKWPDVILKPLSEFLNRYFANRGFEDGLHGLALSLLQAFSFLVVYLKLWESSKFEEQAVAWPEIRQTLKKSGREISYWLKYTNLSRNPLKRIIQKIGNRVF